MLSGVVARNERRKRQLGRQPGKRGNQNFVSIPHAHFVEMLTYKAGLLELHVLVNEESYTSKDGFLDADLLPIYDASRQGSPVFSGRRMKRR